MKHDHSIVIPCYNCANFVHHAIDSAIAQKPDVQIICVDDGSTDSIDEIFKAYGSRIHWDRCSNAGPAAARNRGLALATGLTISFLDSDDFYEPNAASHLSSVLQKCEADVVFGKHQTLGSDDRPGRNATTTQNATREALLQRFAEIRPVQTAAIMWRTSFLRSLGGWDERIPHMEDIDLVMRALLSGAKFAAIDTLVSWYTLRNSGFRLSHSTTAEKFQALTAVVTTYPERLPDKPRAREFTGVFLYSIARQAFRSGYVGEGHIALRAARDSGFRGHAGSRAHTLGAQLLGLALKERLAVAVRPPRLPRVRATA